jgi:hypothetical protein
LPQGVRHSFKTSFGGAISTDKRDSDFRAARADINDSTGGTLPLDDPSYRVKYRIFGSSDGLPGTWTGAEIQGTDGKLWFMASKGLVWLDPANFSTNSLPPRVLIRSVRGNGRQAVSLTNLVLPPRTTDLQIGYTALSLSVPEKVRFRYRLEEVDKDWQDAGTRREAFYTRLGPGKYHFRVIACNNDGVWNEEGARLDSTSRLPGTR